MPVRRQSILREARAAVRRDLVPGDELVASVLATSRQQPFLASLLTSVPAAVGWDLLGTFLSHSFAVGGALAGGVAVGMQPLINRQVVVAVTRHEVLCYRLSPYRSRPTALLSRVPVTHARLTIRRRGLAWTSVRYTAPDRAMRLLVHRRSRADLAAVTAAVHEGSAAMSVTWQADR